MVIGINQGRPKSRKRKSPGSLPKPSFCSNGENQSISNKAKKMTSSQRNMASGLERMAAVALGEAHRLPLGSRAKGHDLEQFAHFVFCDQFKCLRLFHRRSVLHFR